MFQEHFSIHDAILWGFFPIYLPDMAESL